MEFAKELYPTFEEASELSLEHEETAEALLEFYSVLDTAYSQHTIEEASKTLAARLAFIFDREKNRAKCSEDEDEDAHAEYLGAS